LLHFVKAGYHLTKWLSNCPDVLQNLSQDKPSDPRQSYGFSYVQESVLGAQWNDREDQFCLLVKLHMNPCTCRGLSTANSLFDPLGFVAPVVSEACCIFRSLCQQKFEWDEPMPERTVKMGNVVVKSIATATRSNFALHRSQLIW